MTAHTMVRISVDDIVLFAQNTGEFYQTHLAMAKRGTPVRSTGVNDSWLQHVSGPVLTRYCREVESAWATLLIRIRAAEELKAYYERTLAEEERFKRSS